MSLSGQSPSLGKPLSGLQQIKADTVEASTFTADTLTAGTLSVSGLLTSSASFNLGSNLLQGYPTASTPSVAVTGDLNVNTTVYCDKVNVSTSVTSWNVSATNLLQAGHITSNDVSCNAISIYGNACQ